MSKQSNSIRLVAGTQEIKLYYIVDEAGTQVDGRMWLKPNGPRIVISDLTKKKKSGRRSYFDNVDFVGELRIMTTTYRLVGFEGDPKFVSQKLKR